MVLTFLPLPRRAGRGIVLLFCLFTSHNAPHNAICSNEMLRIALLLFRTYNLGYLKLMQLQYD